MEPSPSCAILKQPPIHIYDLLEHFISDIRQGKTGPDEVFKIVQSHPELLKKVLPVYPGKGKTVLWTVCEMAKIHDILPWRNILSPPQDWLKLALKIIGLDPSVDLNALPDKPGAATIFEMVLGTTHACEERTQLIQCLLFCGASIPRSISDYHLLQEIENGKMVLKSGAKCLWHAHFSEEFLIAKNNIGSLWIQ